MNTSLIDIFAGMGMVIDDLLAIISLIGAFIILFMRKPDEKMAFWAVGGLFFGAVGQICLTIKGMPANIGIFQMNPGLVNALLLATLGLLILRPILRRRNY